MQSGVAPVRGGVGRVGGGGMLLAVLLSGEPAAGWEASMLVGKASLLEVILVVLLSLKQLLPHQDLILHVGTSTQCW